MAYLLSGTSASYKPLGYPASPSSYYYFRHMKSNWTGATHSLAWLGFSEGPDSLLAELSAGWDGGETGRFTGLGRWKAKGEYASLGFEKGSDWSEDASFARLRTPSGIAEYSLQLGLEVESASLSLGRRLRLAPEGSVYWTGRWNAGNVADCFDQGWELRIACAISLFH
jgi:hypothetical protein